jgi:hypothetical protein
MVETLVTVHVTSFTIPDAQNICPYFVSHMLVAQLMSSTQVKHVLASTPSRWETDENSWVSKSGLYEGWSHISKLNFCNKAQVCSAMCSQALSWRRITLSLRRPLSMPTKSIEFLGLPSETSFPSG